jgi:hypothetical protein
MDASKFFQSQGTYLNATHVAAGDLEVTIERTEIEKIGKDQQQKLVIYFRELERGLTLNKTNYEALYNAFGPETDGWLGKPVTLFATKTEFDGKQVDGVRLRIAAPDRVPREKWPSPKPVPNDMNDEIPF